jgi:hypothetical protein
LGLIGRKPGCWRLDLQNDHPAYVGLQDGHLVCASADTTRQDFARRLVIEGAVGTNSLAQALRAAGDEGVVGYLRQADLIDPDLLPGLARAHVVAALADLTHWRKGTFHADVVTDLPDDVDIRIPLSELGAEVTALLRKWRAATDILGGPGTVIAAHPGPVPVHLQGLHALIDGRRTVGDLVEVGGHGTVGTVVDVGDLVQSGCAAPVVAGTAAVEQQLAMLSVIEETPAPLGQPGPVHLAVIPGGASADGTAEAVPADEGEEQDLLTVILRGVRGV